MNDCQPVGSCRICGGQVKEPFLDFGLMPLANDYQIEPNADCRRYPLAVWKCDKCGLVQLTHVVAPKVLYEDYAYVTGCSAPMVGHFETFAKRFARPGARVVDIGSNDGTLPAAFVALGCEAIAIEPARNIECKVPKIVSFFNEAAVAEAIDLLGGKADIVTATNVCAHVDDLSEFLGYVRNLLSDDGRFIAEWPDWARTAEAGAFDQIYHEHLSYFTFGSFAYALRQAGLQAVQLEYLPVHGGSLRVMAAPARENEFMPLPPPNSTVAIFARKAGQIIKELPLFLEGRKGHIAGYGAPAKATTLLNAAKIDETLLPYTVDSTPFKVGRYIPGTSIPIRAESALGYPEYVLILAWNFADEIMQKLPTGTRGAVPIPFPSLL